MKSVKTLLEFLIEHQQFPSIKSDNKSELALNLRKHLATLRKLYLVVKKLFFYKISKQKILPKFWCHNSYPSYDGKKFILQHSDEFLS